MAKLSQMHRNLGKFPTGLVYITLRRAYPIETGASDLQKLQDITMQREGSHFYTKKPNIYPAVLSDNVSLIWGPYL